MIKIMRKVWKSKNALGTKPISKCYRTISVDVKLCLHLIFRNSPGAEK